jgi:ATP-dependent 26S proteasome regulatory subunit
MYLLLPVIVSYLATSNIDAIDSAITRPGRIDIHIHLPFPNRDAILDLLENSLKMMPNQLAHSDLLDLAILMQGKSSGEIVDLCREAAMNCIRCGDDIVVKSHFRNSINRAM